GRSKFVADSPVLIKARNTNAQKKSRHTDDRPILTPAVSNTVLIQRSFSHHTPTKIPNTSSTAEPKREILRTSQTGGNWRGLHLLNSQFWSFTLSSTANAMVTTANAVMALNQRM